MGKRTFDIDLLDTKTGRIIQSGTAQGRFSAAALRNFSKTLPKSVNLTEMRDATHARYFFLHKERK